MPPSFAADTHCLAYTEFVDGRTLLNGGSSVKPRLTDTMLIARDALKELYGNDACAGWVSWVKTEPALFDRYGGEEGLRVAYARRPVVEDAIDNLLALAADACVSDAELKAYEDSEPESVAGAARSVGFRGVP